MNSFAEGFKDWWKYITLGQKEIFHFFGFMTGYVIFIGSLILIGLGIVYLVKMFV